MVIYTVHEPPARRRATRRGPDRFMFVRDGFYFWAFLFGPLWMLRHRLWLVLLGYVLLAIAVSVGIHYAQVPRSAAFAIGLLLAILLGLEAGSLRRWTLRRRGWREVGVVSASDVESAEQRFFERWTEGGFISAGEPAATGRQSGRPMVWPNAPLRRPAEPGSDVVGLFPEPGGSR